MIEPMKFIINYLEGRQWTSPTQIGEAAGKAYDQASGWASPKCRKLVAAGKLERSDKGSYRIKKESVFGKASDEQSFCVISEKKVDE